MTRSMAHLPSADTLHSMTVRRSPYIPHMHHTPRPLRAVLTLAALLLEHGTATAQPAAATVTRADLAWRYLLMDATYAARDSAGRIADSTRAALNRMFDRSTLSFFGGKFALTAAMMDSAITMVDPSYRSAPRALPAGVTSDVVAPGKGPNPSTRPVSDLWRSYRGANGAEVPMRVIAPKGATSRAMGVLIALHGAGGDENMFADGYGQGIAARLARENDLLFVSPATAPFMSGAGNFDSLMTVLGREYTLDASRVYVIGHSMGAGAAARLAQERPQALAAVVCLAGGAAVTAAGAPPILFIGAQLDPIIPAARVKAAATATPTGRYEERQNEGHTLMVRGGVIRGIAWMLEQPPRR